MQISGKQPFSPTKVYVVAENRLLRETLVRLFRKRSDINIVGNTCCSDSSLETIASVKPDLLLLDCFNANPVAANLIADLRESTPVARIVLFGMDEDPEVFLRAVRLGVDGYVLKNASAAELLDAMRAVAQGEAACPAKFCKVLFKTVVNSTTEAKEERVESHLELTQRQRQLMSLVAMGLSNKEMAENMNF